MADTIRRENGPLLWTYLVDNCLVVFRLNAQLNTGNAQIRTHSMTVHKRLSRKIVAIWKIPPISFCIRRAYFCYLVESMVTKVTFLPNLLRNCRPSFGIKWKLCFLMKWCILLVHSIFVVVPNGMITKWNYGRWHIIHSDFQNRSSFQFLGLFAIYFWICQMQIWLRIIWSLETWLP